MYIQNIDDYKNELNKIQESNNVNYYYHGADKKYNVKDKITKEDIEDDKNIPEYIVLTYSKYVKDIQFPFVVYMLDYVSEEYIKENYEHYYKVICNKSVRKCFMDYSIISCKIFIDDYIAKHPNTNKMQMADLFARAYVGDKQAKYLINNKYSYMKEISNKIEYITNEAEVVEILK